jgi:hypothetical protein
MLGTVRSPAWGPLLLVGLGGLHAEVVADTAMRLLPVRDDDVDAMLRELRGARLLEGFRGRPAVDRERLVATIVAFGRLAFELGDQLETMEVNPLRVDGRLAEALDAVIVWRRAG